MEAKVKESQTFKKKEAKVVKSVSDIIEEFIMNSLDSDDFIELSRNDLAKFFSCVPSQINYVLNTRFTLNRGFVVESQRGGGGYIKVMRLVDTNSNFLNKALNLCEKPMSQVEGNQLIMQMRDKNLITDKEEGILKSATSGKALNNPINFDDKLRSSILKQVVIELMKNQDRKGE
ncbi:MAG: CtsR family transcriptional regulator [Candidatus Onthoplasma sp.]